MHFCLHQPSTESAGLESEHPCPVEGDWAVAILGGLQLCRLEAGGPMMLAYLAMAVTELFF
jgi:hypothetical protein